MKKVRLPHFCIRGENFLSDFQILLCPVKCISDVCFLALKGWHKDHTKQRCLGSTQFNLVLVCLCLVKCKLKQMPRQMSLFPFDFVLRSSCQILQTEVLKTIPVLDLQQGERATDSTAILCSLYCTPNQILFYLRGLRGGEFWKLKFTHCPGCLLSCEQD